MIILVEKSIMFLRFLKQYQDRKKSIIKQIKQLEDINTLYILFRKNTWIKLFLKH